MGKSVSFVEASEVLEFEPEDELDCNGDGSDDSLSVSESCARVVSDLVADCEDDDDLIEGPDTP